MHVNIIYMIYAIKSNFFGIYKFIFYYFTATFFIGNLQADIFKN